MKTIQDQGKKTNKFIWRAWGFEKESSTHSRQKESFEDLANKRIDEIKTLNKQTDMNNLTYHSKGKSATKDL